MAKIKLKKRESEIHIDEAVGNQDKTSLSESIIKDEKSEVTKTEVRKEKKQKEEVGSVLAQTIPEIYTDEVFQSIKEVINDRECKSRGIRIIQYGRRLNFYQGNPSNMWGVVEARENNGYHIRIMNSLLKRILKQDKRTFEIFKDVL